MVRETRHLWVGNLPETVREDRIRDHFKRYGRVQSVKIITPPQSSSSSSSVSSSCTVGTPRNDDIDPSSNTNNLLIGGNHTPNSISPSDEHHSHHHHAGSVGATLCLCATVSFMDIKSASKAHHMEHKLDDRILTTEYYEPSSVVVTNDDEMGTTNATGGTTTTQKNLIINNNNSSSNNNINGQNASLPQYSSLATVNTSSSSTSANNLSNSSCNKVPGETISSRRFSTSHGSDDHSSSHGFDRNFYSHTKSRDNRSSLLSSSCQLEPCIDNANCVHHTSGNHPSSALHRRLPHGGYHGAASASASPGSASDVVVVRGRARDRHYTSNRNGAYSTCVDRSTPIGHHRISSNNWYESSSSSSSRNLYGSTIKSETSYESPHLERSNSNRSDLLDTSNNSKSRHHSSSNAVATHNHTRHTSSTNNNINATVTNSVNSTSSSSTHHNNSRSSAKKKKSRSGSGTPCSTSSRSRSHSRSSCTSSNSDSSNESGGSPVPSSRNLQSAIGTAPICTNSSSSSLAGSSAGSSSSHHHLGDDTRSLAIRVRNLPVRSSDTSIKDGLFHEYKKNGKVTWVKVVGTNIDRYAIVCFKKAEDAEKALEDSKDKLFFGCRIDVELYQGFDLQDSDFRAYEAELDEFHPKATRTLFIGNLEKDISASELRKYFDTFGEIIDIDIKKQGLTAYAFCQYANIVSVVKAMRKMDGEHLGNNRIKLGFGKSMHTNCVWIDGVADTVSENYLISQFSRFGPVEGVVIDRERKLALITFEQNQNAQLAVKEMRGTTLRSRKIQIDFASRECQTAFYEKLNITNKNKGVSFETTVTVPGSRSYNNSSRYENASSTSSTSSSRGRAASFSRPNNPLSGAASPSSTTSGNVAGRPRQIRYTSTTTDYYSSNNDPNDVVSLAHDRRIRSYDEFSQGSGASHEDLYEATSTSGSIRGGSISRDHVESPQSRLGSVISSVGDNSSNLHINNSSSCNSRVANINIDETTTQLVVAPAANAVRRRENHPGDIKPLLRERTHLLEQLEECPSSGDELVSPKKRRYGSNYVIDHSTTNNHHDASSANNIGEHNNIMPNNHHHHYPHPHRKGVEIRRLSEASLKQHTAASQLHSSSSTNNSNCNNNNNSRRPSTDSLSRSSSIIDHTFSGSLTKRRKTSVALPPQSNDDHHSSSGRGHRLHSMHSHEASGGESADGSRPGTPLCDEPSEPRRIPRERSHEPMVLPLPKFAEQFFIKLRQLQKEQQKDTFIPAALQSSSFPSSSTGQTSSQQIPPTVPLALQSSTNIPSAVSNSSLATSTTTLTSPTGTLFSPGLRLQTVSSTPSTPITLNPPTTTTSQVPSDTKTATTTEPTSPNNATTRPPSLPSSNSSDSETEVRNPLLEESSLEERLRALDDKYEKWSGGSGSHRRSHGNNENNGNSAGYRHKLLELDVKEVQPSDIAKTLLAKKSIFDDDSRRLENIGDKYEPREFSNYARSIPAVPLVTAASAIPIQTKPATPPIVEKPPVEKPPVVTPPPPLPVVVNLSQIHQQRLVGSNSPMRSPPYTSPSSASSGNGGASTPVIKQLQYPFPSHPPTAGSTSTTNTATTTTVSSTEGTKTSTSGLQKSNSLPDATNSNNKAIIGNSTNSASNRVLTKSTSMPAGTTTNETQNVETSKNDEKSYKDRRKTSLQEEMQIDPESDQEQKQLKQQQEAEQRRVEAAEREKRENEQQRRQAEKREAEVRREEKLRKEREEAERRAKEENRSRQTEQQQKQDEKPKSERSHNHKHNNSASTSPVRGGNNNKRRLSSPDAPLTNHVETSEVTKKSKPDSGKSLEKTPSKYHHKKEDRSSTPDEKSRHGDKDLFDCLRSEHKSEKHHKLNRKHSSNTTTSHAVHSVKEEQPIVKQEMHRDKENSQTDNTMDNKAFFDAIELRSSEEEQRLRQIRRENKERKDSQDKSTTSGNSCDDGISSKHESRKNSRSDHVSSDDMSGSKKSRSKTSRRTKSSHSHRHPQHNQSQSHTSDETDSDGRKKHSIFDIPDEGPYVSMYDKVKARSCKNMQKQEEKKKTKAKFGKFKRVREAKREGKKRSTSWDEDSDSDDDENVRYRRVSKGLASSSDDDMSHHNRMSDSDGEKMHFNRQKLHELCEGESSDAGNHTKRSPRRKISSRKNSRTTRLALDSSDEDDIKTPIKTELKTEMISEDEESLKINTATIKQEIKEENYQKGLQTPVSAPAMMDNKTSAFDQLFGHESKKKHKKNKKRQKSFPMDSTDEDALPLSERRDTEGEMPKSELDKSLEAVHDRRSSKHGSKKEKKREKTREEHERKKARKANKLMGKQQSLDIKREEKMEDIFGPLSDEESRQSPTNSVVSPSTSAKSSGINAFDQIRKPQQQENDSHESRKQRKEKKRREKHNKITSQNENSVDLDEAGRALEAQLMSDSEKPTSDTHKSNHDEPADVFRFSDGEDSLDSSKKDTSEHRREKKKKKKKSKEEKHKHHHHKNHNDEKLLSPEPMSLPSLVDDHVETHSQSTSKPKTNAIRGNGMTSPPPKALVTSSPVKGEDHKSRKDIFIPGFGGKIDEKIHESAVLSIVETTKVEKETTKSIKSETERPESPSKALGEAKNQAEEKSRVIISQEETEDAVAALLGESFGTSNVTDYNEIFEEPVEEAPVAPEEPEIPAEDDEEMKKAIMSLNTDEMDIKADTPQSENDLQIDTDTEETEEPEKTSQFDNPPKTPDVDFAQIRKNAEKEQENKKIVSPLVARPEPQKAEEPPKKIPVSIPQVKFTAATSITTNANKSFSVLQPPTIKIPAEVQETPKAPQLLSPRAISIPTTSAKQGIASPRRSQQEQKGRQMMSPTKEPQQQIIFHAGTQPGQQLQAPGNAMLNRFPIITQSGSKPIQPTNVLLSQPSQATLSNVPNKQQVHLPPGQQQQPSQQKENQTIFIHQQQTPRGSIQVVHHQVNIPPFFAPNQPNAIPMQRGAHPSNIPPKPEIFVQQAPSANIGEKNIERPTSSTAASTLFDKLKATTDVNPQRLSPHKDDKREDAQDTKEDTEYWSARDVNIDSVIQKLCSEEETGSDSSKNDENSKKPEQNVEKVVQPKPDEVENKPEDVKVKGKGGRKRKNTENNEVPKATTEKIPETPTMQVPNPPVSATNVDEIGVQTRNARTTNAKPTQAKRGNGRGGRGGKQGVQGNKPRNQNSESDVYEFHDDSSDNDNHAKAIDAAAGNVVVPSVTVTPIPVPSTSAPIMPNQIAPPTQTVIAQPLPLNLENAEKSPQQPTSPDGKEDFLSPGQAAANTRKSRRLLERDGSRSTVDDIIEDVVRNSTTQSPKNSPLRQPSSPAGSGTTPVSIPNVVVTQAPVAQTAAGRRNTRQNNLPEKQNLADVRKSPRAGQPGSKKANKDRKLSENSVDSSSDEAKVKLEGVKVEIKPEQAQMTFTEMSHETKVEEKLVIPKQEDVVKASNPVTEAPVRMQYKPIPIEKPPTSNASPKPLTITPQPVIVNLPPGSNPPNSVQNKPPNTTIHLPLPQHSQAEIKVVPLPNPPTSQATAVIQHTPISIQQPPNMTQKLPVTVSQTTFTAGQKPTTHAIPMQMQQQPIKHVIDAKQGASQTVVKICGPPNAPHQQQQTQNQAQQLPPGAIMTKHGPIQPQIHGPTGNLVINIPPGSVSVTQQQSPRMQTSHMMTKQQQQGMPPHPQGVQILQQTKQPSQSPGPQMIQVNSQQQQQQQQQQNQQQQLQTQMMIHGKPVQIQGPGGYTTVFQGTKIIHQGPQNTAQQSQQGPPPGKQYQVQQIQLTPGQPLPQGTIVTQQSIKMSKSGELQLPQTQQIHIPNKPAHQNKQQVQQQQQQQPPSLPHHLVKQGSITIQQAQTPPNMHASAKQQMAAPQIQPQQQQNTPQMQVKGNMIGLHQAPQILTGAVASPPLKHSHVQSQQPIVAGASSSRVPPPTMSPQGRAHALQAGMPVSAFEHASLHREKGVYSSVSAHSPPPAHQQATPITPGDGNFPPGQIRAMPREYYHPNYIYQQHVQRQQEALAVRLPPHLPRSPMLPGTAEPVMSEVDESMVASPPLELRRPASGPRITSVPLSLQSPGDRATDSPLVYIHGARVPHYPHDPNHARFYEGRLEPPPAHRANAPGSSQYVGNTPPPTPASLLHIQREREEREQRERAAAAVVAAGNNPANSRGVVVRAAPQHQQDSQILVVGHPNMPPHAGLVPAMPELSTRGMQIATPPHGSQVPHSAESLDSLLKRYPVMWQGLLALKNDQAAVQMHFVYGSRDVAVKSLPRNIEGSNPPLRIAQRMRLEPAQIDGVARKMQVENEHCMLLALPCGRDHYDVLTQSTNLQSGFITYLQQKQAAGIVNIAEPGSQQASYVVHIFPSCEFANESLTRIAPDLLHRVQNIAHLLIVIATV